MSGDGKNIIVQADHPTLSWQQLLAHEELHRRIKGDDAYRRSVQDALLADEKLKPYLSRILDRYTEAYRAIKPGIADAEIVEELLVDYRAGFDMLDPLGLQDRNTARAARAAAKDIRAVERKAEKSGEDNPLLESQQDERYSIEFQNSDKGIAAYEENQLARWANTKKIVFYSGTDSVIDFATEALVNKDFSKKLYFGYISETLGQKIEDDTGVEFYGKNLTLRADNVRKVKNDHGTPSSERTRGQAPVEPIDYAMVPVVVQEYDSAEAGNFRGNPAVLFIKTIGNRRYNVVVSDSGGTLEAFVQTYYINEKISKNTEGVFNMADSKTPGHTPEATVGTTLDEKDTTSEGKVNSESEGSASIEIDPEVAAQFSPQAIAERETRRSGRTGGKKKVSKVRSNTCEYSGLCNEVEAQMSEADEQNFTYDPISEKKSMNVALGRLRKDFDGEVGRLSEADRQWGGSDLDTAMGILHRYRTEGRATGDYSRFWDWSKTIQEKVTKGGQFIQAFAKYTRTGTPSLSPAVEMHTGLCYNTLKNDSSAGPAPRTRRSR